MRKLILLVVLFLAGCSQVEPGNYYVVPVTGTLQGTVEHVCYNNECWNVAMLPTETVIPPTQEQFTPVPTITNTPIPTVGECVLIVTGDTVNVRSAPVVLTGNVLGQVHKDDPLKPDGYVMSGGFKWYHIWFDENNYGFVRGDLVTIKVGTDCSMLPVVQLPAWLIHTVPGVNEMALEASYPVLSAKNIKFGVKSYSDTQSCTAALVRGGLCIFRWPVNGDCPNSSDPDPKAVAFSWMKTYQRALMPLWDYASTDRLIVEIVNECYYGSSSDIGTYYWWATFIEEAVDYAVEYGWPPIIIPTFGPGYGDDALQYSIWKTALLKLKDANGLIGFHAYTPYLDTGLCGCDKWLACRHRLNYQVMLSQGIDLHYAITEAAAGWGNEPVSVDDYVCWWEQIKHDKGLHSVSLWIGGYHQAFPKANLDGYYVPLANRITS